MCVPAGVHSLRNVTIVFDAESGRLEPVVGESTTFCFRERLGEIFLHGGMDGFQLTFNGVQTILSQKSHWVSSLRKMVLREVFGPLYPKVEALPSI